MLLELENLQHRALPKQPDCLTVQLYEHQKQDAQWMKDQENLKGGSMRHLWAELPPHPDTPVVGSLVIGSCVRNPLNACRGFSGGVAHRWFAVRAVGVTWSLGGVRKVVPLLPSLA